VPEEFSMPFKVALALALSVVLSAPIALAAPTDATVAPSHAAVHKAAKPGKSRPSSPKVAASSRRKHVIDNKPDAHGQAISMAKPLDGASRANPSPDAKKGEAKKSDMKHVGKKREARRADAKKSAPKSGDKQAPTATLAAALSADLPPLPADEPTPAPPAPARTLLARGKKGQKPPCLHAPIHVMRGTDDEEVTLTKCDGSPAPGSADKMGLLLRPGGSDKPAVSIDAGLIERLGLVTEHFAKDGAASKVSIVSGSRPSSAGSYHASGRAMDFRVDGVKNEDLVAFCKTLTDTGCGYYPNSSFVHMDVRDPGTGHVTWIDASGPGEAPRYVSQWPPPAAPADDTHDKKETRAMIEDLLATIEKELPPLTKPDATPAPDAPAPAATTTIPAPKAEMERDLP
jgi:Bacterial protein of unknown function (DUF882)